jgi:hypothetical protein
MAAGGAANQGHVRGVIFATMAMSQAGHDGPGDDVAARCVSQVQIE